MDCGCTHSCGRADVSTSAYSLAFRTARPCFPCHATQFWDDGSKNPYVNRCPSEVWAGGGSVFLLEKCRSIGVFQSAFALGDLTPRSTDAGVAPGSSSFRMVYSAGEGVDNNRARGGNRQSKARLRGRHQRSFGSHQEPIVTGWPATLSRQVQLRASPRRCEEVGR